MKMVKITGIAEMKKSKFFPIIILFPLLPFSAPVMGWTLKGAGDITCGEVLEENRNSEIGTIVNRQWLLGFISGINYVEGKTTSKGIHVDALWHSILKYCRENPLNELADASMGLYYILENK